ncbi:MAG TPA: rhodanese-like domain-containing protein [Pyrinomonadaceae bacterium]|nr:rhodanese-like domain-containing protein [Pyrinomonadaceae bacterium]
MTGCSVLALSEKVAAGSAILVDVREWPEFAAGRVPGSRLIPLADISKRSGELDKARDVFLICRTGRRSAEAASRLRSLGFENVVNVEGGFEAWKKNKLPVERDERAPWSIERQVRFTAGLLVLAGIVLSLFVHPYFISISALIGFGLAFSSAIDWCGMGILLAKMPWNRRVI